MQKGFTLIELMIVIAIIGILAAIALPAYQDYVARSQVTEAINLMSGYKSAVSENYGSSAECPDNRNNAQFGLAIPREIHGKYVNEIEAKPTAVAGSCELTAKFRSSGVAEPIRNKTITLTMTVTSGGETWNCMSRELDGKYLPSACRPS